MVLLSVILPNYNHAKFLRESLSAILSQSFDSFEVIVVDDASTDQSLDILREYQKKYPEKIRLIEHRQNAGPVQTFNEAVQLSQGKYIAQCSADDKVLPGFFYEGIQTLEAFPKAALCTTNFCCFYDGEDKLFAERGLDFIHSATFFSPRKIISLIQNYDFWIPGNGSLFRKQYMIECGLLKKELKGLCDWFLSMMMALKYGICYIPKPLASFRIVKNSFSSNFNSSQFDALFSLFEQQEFRAFKRDFFRSGMVFQLDKTIFQYIKSRPEYQMQYLLMLLQKLKRKIFKKRYKRMLREIKIEALI